MFVFLTLQNFRYITCIIVVKSHILRETLHRARPIILDRNIKYKEVTDKNNNEEAGGDDDEEEGDPGYERVTAVPVMLLSDANNIKETSDSDEEYCC